MVTVKNKVAIPKRILAIKFSSIGDIVLTMSPIISLRTIFPNAKIDILTLHDYVPILEGNKYIDKIIPFTRKSDFIKLIKTGTWINNSDYDLVIDFHNSLRSRIIRFFVRKIQKYYLKKPRWKRFLLFRFHKNYFEDDFSQLKLLHQPIANLSTTNEYPLPYLLVSEEEKKQTHVLLKKKGITKPYITIVPGAAWPQKSWLIEYYHHLLVEIKRKNDVDFVILGGKNDEICSEISKYNSKILNLQGKTNLREAMAILSNSKNVIGADTGLTHIAEALGKRVAVILGPTTRETGAGTNRKDSIIIENKEIWCRPCSQNGKRKCYRDEQYCMTTLSPELVYDKIFQNMIV